MLFNNILLKYKIHKLSFIHQYQYISVFFLLLSSLLTFDTQNLKLKIS